MAIVRTTKLPADLQKNSDHVHQYVMFFVWNILEINALIISSCIPTLVPLWDLVRGRAASKYKIGARNISGHKTFDARYAHNAVSSKKGRDHQGPDSLTNSSQVYINLESQSNGIGSDERSENIYTASVSAQENMNHVKQGIHVAREVNVTNAPG